MREDEDEALAAHNLDDGAALAQEGQGEAHDFCVDDIQGLADVHRSASAHHVLS